MISIIIPTLNASKFLPDLLTKLVLQTVKDKEIMVIDSSSRDDTVEIAKSFNAKVVFIPKEEFDHGGTRNLGGIESKGDILVYMTQDTIPANEYSLENLIKPLHNNNEIAAIFGRQLPNADASAFSAHLRLFNYPDTSCVRCLEDRSVYGIKTVFFSNSFSAYRRSALEEIGWFKKGLIFGEDTHAVAKLLFAGYRVAYAADALVYHSHNYTAFHEFKRYFDIGVLHRTENGILKEFGKTKGEGKKYIRSEVHYLMEHKKYSLFPAFILRNALKYLGYHLGLKYSHIPKNLACKMSMNKNWWENRP
ncbi:MAG: glycosyltransferase family 2 protein [Nitrospirae bacterium]|nr:glycosyltransferase family 2 protein [Nitrospirota bacterium]